MRTFERSLPMSLLKAREAVMKRFIPHLRAHDLSPQQWRVLRALYDNEGLEISTLSERCFLLMPSLSRIVQNLETRQLVSRRIAEHDQRCSIISLTPSGHELVELMAPESEARYAHITQIFGYGKLELLYELLDELVEKLEEADKSTLEK
ncbi:MAG: homoprotocatechuate degradation operon regulator HpaR [Thiothrix sp.]|nr:MAG: homoprotocatechuate degradation operon regulator HpaR [Thiothrix sp.]